MDDLLKDYCTGLVTLVIRKSFLDNNQPAFDGSFNIMGDFDLMIRMSSKYKFECVDKPIASWRSHWKNESLLKKNNQIKELRIWSKKMENYPIIFNNKNFSHINNKIDHLETVSLILDNDRERAKLQIRKARTRKLWAFSCLKSWFSVCQNPRAFSDPDNSLPAAVA